jgi:hypothetical protein
MKNENNKELQLAQSSAQEADGDDKYTYCCGVCDNENTAIKKGDKAYCCFCKYEFPAGVLRHLDKISREVEK